MSAVVVLIDNKYQTTIAAPKEIKSHAHFGMLFFLLFAIHIPHPFILFVPCLNPLYHVLNLYKVELLSPLFRMKANMIAVKTKKRQLRAALIKQHKIVFGNGVASAMPFLRFAGHDLHIPFSVFHSQFSFHYLQHRKGNFAKVSEKIFFKKFSHFLIREKIENANSLKAKF